MEKAGQPRILKKHNKSLIQKLIKEHGPVTKPQLSHLTNLSLPTVNKITDELVAEGYAMEASVQKCPGAGRKAKLYVVNENFGMFLAVYYMGGNWLGCLVNITGNVVFETEWQAIGKGDTPQVKVLTNLIDILAAQSERVMAIGVGVPGIVRRDGTIEGIPLLPDFEGVNLEEILRERYGIPVYIENDVKLMTVGYRNLRMNNLDDIVFLYIGNGLGAGILLNGALYKGSCSFAGEFGYMPSGCAGEEQKEENLETRLTFLREKIKQNAGDQRYKLQFCREICRALVHCITVINPEAVVLYCDEIDESSAQFIQREIGSYIPKTCVPQVRHTSNQRIGINGLIYLCQEGITRKNWLPEVV